MPSNDQTSKLTAFPKEILCYNECMPEPNFIIDTAPEAEAVLIRLLRAKPPARRLEEAVAASNRVAEQCKQAIRRMNPKLSEAEVRLRFIEINYGKDLAENVKTYLAGKR